MDVYDEFEFKPLTEGLGFHKKQVQLKEERKKADQNLSQNAKVLSEKEDLDSLKRPNQVDEVRRLVEDFPSIAHDFITENERQKRNEPRIENPLPRNDLSVKEILDRNEPELKVNPEIFDRKIDLVPEMKPLIEQTGKENRVQKTQTEVEEKARPSISAYFIDLLTIIGLTNVFLAVMLIVTEVDVVYVLTHPNSDIVTKLSLATLFVAVWLFYLLTSRIFFGKSLGEWAMDLQMGRETEQYQMSYPLKLTYRFLINAITGIILVPLLSLVTGKDLLGKITGIETYRRSIKWE